MNHEVSFYAPNISFFYCFLNKKSKWAFTVLLGYNYNYQSWASLTGHTCFFYSVISVFMTNFWSSNLSYSVLFSSNLSYSVLFSSNLSYSVISVFSSNLFIRLLVFFSSTFYSVLLRVGDNSDWILIIELFVDVFLRCLKTNFASKSPMRAWVVIGSGRGWA